MAVRLLAIAGGEEAVSGLHNKEWFMLVLSRKKGEVIRIGDTITVTVNEIIYDHDSITVKLGIVAPGMQVHRKTVWLKLTPEDRAKPPRESAM